MNNFIQIFPTTCPSCLSPLNIKRGDKQDSFKLYCTNNFCEGGEIKKLQKGIEILEIKSLGPATIEKLYSIGIKSSIDLFDNSLLNEENLINSGLFKKGKQLDNILESIKNIKEIDIKNAIHSLQITIKKEDKEGEISIGNALSEQIGKYISNVPYCFDGLSINIKNDILNEGEIYKNILNCLNRFESFGIKIIKNTTEPVREIKKISKKVMLRGFTETPVKIKELNWDITEELENSEIIIIPDRFYSDSFIEVAKNLDKKIFTIKQIEIMF